MSHSEPTSTVPDLLDVDPDTGECSVYVAGEPDADGPTMRVATTADIAFPAPADADRQDSAPRLRLI